MTEDQRREEGQPDLEDVKSLLAAQPDVLAAYIFGSTVSGRVRATSDPDLAVLLDGDPSPGGLTERRLE